MKTTPSAPIPARTERHIFIGCAVCLTVSCQFTQM